MNQTDPQYRRGYMQAMIDVQVYALDETLRASHNHGTISPSFFGFPRPAHYIELGKSRAALALSEFANGRVQEMKSANLSS